MQSLADQVALVPFETLKDKVHNAKTQHLVDSALEMVDLKALFETLAEV